MDDRRKMMVLQVVWDHWVKPDIEARKAALDARRRFNVSGWLTRRARLDQMLYLAEMWEEGIEVINGHDVRAGIVRRARMLWNENAAAGACIDCGRHVMRVWHETDGFSIACSSGECDNVDAFLP